MVNDVDLAFCEVKPVELIGFVILDVKCFYFCREISEKAVC
jgi:hypothetical protein